MRYVLLSLLMVGGKALAEEGQGEVDWHSSYVQLETQQKHLESLVAKTAEDHHVLKGELLSLNEMQDKLAHFQQVTAELIKENHQLVSRLDAQEGKEGEYLSLLTQMMAQVEKMDDELAKFQDREVQNKSRYQSINARVDNLAQQVDELQRQAVAKNGKK